MENSKTMKILYKHFMPYCPNLSILASHSGDEMLGIYKYLSPYYSNLGILVSHVSQRPARGL